MSVMVAEITASAALSLPKDGLGNVTVAYGSDIVTSGAEVYTANTCEATWTNPPSGGAVGDIVATQDGYWGVWVSGTATVLTVDYWRTKGQGRGIPTAGQDCRVYNGKCILAGARTTYLHRMIFSALAAGTVDITNLWGTVLYRHTIAAAPLIHVLEFCSGQGEPGLFFDQPIAIKSSVAGNTVTIVFSA